jgi:hypothetical protein
MSVVVLMLTIPTLGEPRKIGRVYDVRGVGSVIRQAAAPRPLAVTEYVLVDDTITVARQSHVRIGFAPGVVAELGQGSVVTLLEEAGRAVLRLDDGRVSYRVSRERDRRDEVRAVLTPNAIAWTTGSVSVRVGSAPETGLVTTICVTKGAGHAEVPGKPDVPVPERHCVVVSDDVVGAVTPLPPPTPMPPDPPKPSIRATTCRPGPTITRGRLSRFSARASKQDAGASPPRVAQPGIV